MVENEYPTAPTCPAWCGGHETGTGWDVCAGGVTKTCRRVTHCDGGADVIVERFASIVDGRVIVAPTEMLVWCVDALTVAEAVTLGHTLRRVAELIHEPVAA